MCMIETTKHVGFQMEMDDWARISSLARREQRSISAVIRLACQRAMREEGFVVEGDDVSFKSEVPRRGGSVA